MSVCNDCWLVKNCMPYQQYYCPDLVAEEDALDIEATTAMENYLQELDELEEIL